MNLTPANKRLEVILKIPWSNVLWGIAIGALLISIFLLAWQKSHQPVQIDYEGTIVERWANFYESETGSHVYYKLLVEDNSGKRVAVNLDYETYTRAQIGMHIRRSTKGIELSGKPAQSTPLGP